MAKNIKKGQRIGRKPKAGTEPISSRPVIVFKPSAVLKRRINGRSPGGVA
jgi:integration host factor subunit alpha